MPRFAILVVLALSLTASASAQSRSGQRPASFVDAATVVPGLIVEMRYSGSHNFVGAPIDGYDKPACLLTRQAAAALAQVAHDLAPRGLVLKVFDCYRPARAVAHFVRWARNIADVARKSEFYPEVDKRNLFRDGYIASVSGHSRGSTMDLTLARRADGQGDGQENARELDMGTPFDFFSPRSWPSDRHVSAEAQANRAWLAQAMRRRGFVPYRKEWWHFTLRHEPFPDSYFDFAVR
jgi:D-alanyl-D-alanine dipeptidase